MAGDIIPLGQFKDLSKRKLFNKTCRLFGYHVTELKGQRVQVADYRNSDGEVVFQKVRFPDKSFTCRGKSTPDLLFGKHLWGDGGRQIVITEGEIDALSVSQVLNNKWPVVSIASGAQSASKSVKANLDWLERFENIILMFDNDTPGVEAAKECSRLLSPAKVKIASLPLKDPSDMLQAGRGDEIVTAIFNAKPYRIDGIYSAAEALELPDQSYQVGIPFPWKEVTDWTYGQRPHEMIAYGAGTGIGKTTNFKQIAASNIQHGQKCGMILFEEPDIKLTISTIAGMIDGVTYHIPETLYDAAQRQATETMLGEKLFLYKVDGPVGTDKLLSLVRYMVVVCGCNQVFLDHITYILDGAAEADQLAEMKKLMRAFKRHQ